jgi:predicted  nucleic acid-binding Zn-ribbon protein
MAPDSLRALISLQTMEFNEADEQKTGIGNKEEQLRQMVPSDVLDVYDTLKERFQEQTVVRVDNGACTGCHIMVPSSLSIEITNNVFLCEHCGRMLYSSENSTAKSLA